MRTYSKSSPSSAPLWALLSWTLLSTACTRTRVVEVPKVEIRTRTVTKIVQVDRCPTTLPVLPTTKPVRADQVLCDATFGKGALCYDPASAASLGITFDALVSLYLERSLCEPGTHDANPDPPVAPPLPH